MEDQTRTRDPLDDPLDDTDERVPALRTGRDRRLVVAAALLVPPLVCLALVPWRERVEAADAALVLVLVVVAVAATGIRAAGPLAALSSALWLNLLLTRPTDDPPSATPTTCRRWSC